MNTCSQANCRNTDLRPYKMYLRDRFTLLCGSCHSSLTAIGMSLEPAERRQIDVRPMVERRHSWTPDWLRNLRGSDRTDYAA